MEYERYALYYAPPHQSVLAKFGNNWLGWDPESRVALNRPANDRLSVAEIEAITKAPSRYGFHGTLKPPFKLKEGKTLKQLELAIDDLAMRLTFIVCGPLELKKIGHFLALVPSNCHKALARFAGNCVKELDDFRAPPTDQELAKRRQAQLSANQEELLIKWGYPYVMDEFRFHLTLTDQLNDEQMQSAHKMLQGSVSQISSLPFEISEICLFGDPGNGQPFHLLKRFSC